MTKHQLRSFSSQGSKKSEVAKGGVIRKAKPKEVKQLKQKTTVAPILSEENRVGYKVCPVAKTRHEVLRTTASDVRKVSADRPIPMGHWVDDLGLVHVFCEDIKSVRSIKPNFSIHKAAPANGQYTRLSASCRQFQYIIDRYQPTIVFKQSLVDCSEPLEAIWVKRDGEWQATRILTSEEYNSFVVFAGSCVIDLDKLIREKSSKLKVEGKRNNPTRFTGKAVELEKFNDGVKQQVNHKAVITKVSYC